MKVNGTVAKAVKASGARVAPAHRLGRMLGSVAFAGLPFACVPLDELAAYSEGAGADRPRAVSGQADDEPAPTQVMEPLEAGDAAVGSGGSASTEGAPDDIGLSDSVVDEGVVGTSPEAAPVPAPDAGAPATLEPVDAASPVPVDAAPEPPPECSVGQRRNPRGTCFVVVETALAWQEARSGCQTLGAGWDLATARSAADSQLLSSLARAQVWLGATDAVNEGTWAWVDDGLELWSGDGTGVALNGAFTNWFDDEPNGEESSDCLRMLVDGTWADLECEEVRGSVCEGPPLVR